jgi:hypothetical protein
MCLQLALLVHSVDITRNGRSAEYAQLLVSGVVWLSNAQYHFSENSSIDKCMSTLCICSRSFEKYQGRPVMFSAGLCSALR